MKIVKLKKTGLKETVSLVKKILENDGLAVIPADTVYVLAAKATSSAAVKKVLDFKGRRFQKGISVFLNNLGEIKDYAHLDPKQAKVVQALLPGYFTIVLKSKDKLAAEIEPGDGTVGLRVVEEEFIKRLTQALDFPITATSANTSGKGPHYSIPSFLRTLSEKKKQELDLVIDAGKLERIPASTVVRLVRDEIKILRKGLLTPNLLLREETESEAETRKLAQKIYQFFLKKNLQDKAVVVILRGELGSGKTVFAKGIGELFNQQFSSPSFILMDEYLINQKPVSKIYHLDLFRLETDEEVTNLRLEEFLKKGNLILIEWGEKLSTFQSFKKEKTAFFLLQIEEGIKARRGFKFYQL
jgi:L-threonylcarbamoyladenylate synthase